MPYRRALHSMIETLADLGIFEGRTVTFQVVNGRDVRWAYEPPLSGAVAREVATKEVYEAKRLRAIAKAIDRDGEAVSTSDVVTPPSGEFSAVH